MKINKIFVFLLLGVFLISFTSADLLDSAEFNESDGDYGSYDIDSFLPSWLGGGDKADIRLIDNTDQCLINCKATLEGYFHEPRTLIDEIKFIDRHGNEVEYIKDLRFKIGQWETIEYEVPIYSEEVCEEKVSINGTYYDECSRDLIRTEIETKDEFTWKEYNGEEINGYYQLEITAKKNPKQKVDWIITVFGEELTEWAWWDSDWVFKREISSLNGSISALYNITFDSDMKSDFGDLRFLDFSTESIELNYTIISKVDSTSAMIRVDNIGETEIYMYYGNSLATSNSNFDNLYLSPEAYYAFDNVSTDDYTTNDNDGSYSGILYSQPGVIGTSIGFDGINDKIQINSVSTGTSWALGIWFKTTYVGAATPTLFDSSNGGLDRNIIRKMADDFQMVFYNVNYKIDDWANINDGNWHYVLVIADGTSGIVYLDNVKKIDTTITDTSIGTSVALGNHNSITTLAFDGDMDETVIYNKSISSTQATILYEQNQPNFIVGIEQKNAGVDTRLLSPLDNLQSTETNIEFSVNSSSVAFTQIDNVTLFIWNATDNSLVISNFTALDSNTSVITNWTNNLTTQGNYIWNAETCGEGVACSRDSNRTLTVHFTTPLVNIDEPTGLLDYFILGNNQTLSYNVSEPGENLTEHIEDCWYEYNFTNNTLNCSDNEINFTYIQGINNITVYANDTFGLLSSNTSSWEYKILEVNQTFNNITTEGATEEFIINIVKDSSLQVSTINLVYNGTINSFPYSVSGDNVISQSTIVIPVVDSDINITFYWNITLDDGSNIITSTNNQTILSINVDDCSSFTNIIYNFTQYDEENKSILSGNNTIELQINLFDTEKTVLLTSFSNKFENINPVQFCAEAPILPTVNYSAYVVVKYFLNSTDDSKSYSVEYYNILNQTIGNITIPININLYNLKVSDTTKFRLTFRNNEYVLAPNILVQVHRQYIKDNSFTIVEIPLTDSNGQTVLNLVKDVIIYNFVMVNEAGEVVGTFNSIAAFCSDSTIGNCRINLAPDSLSKDMYDYNEEFDISISDASYDNSTKKISVSFVTGDLTPKNVRMEIIRNNDFGNRSVCSDSLFSASGILSCNVSSITDTDQFLFISTSVENDLAKEDAINLNSNILNFGTLNGAFYAFFFILILITLFMEDRKILVISLGLGWVGVISLGLVNGKFIGATSAGIWILVSIMVFLWKLTKEDSL